MKQNRRGCAALLAVLLSLTLTATARAYNDTAAHPLAAQIDRAAGLGIAQGYPDGSFRPQGGVSRAEFCALVNRTLGLYALGNAVFTDVSAGAWYAGEIRTAAALGYIQGKGAGRFDPEGAVTRWEAAAMLARLTDWKPGSQSYTDAQNAPAWAAEGMAFAGVSGVFSDFTGERFDGGAALNRGQTAAVLVALLDWLKALPVFVTQCAVDPLLNPLDTRTVYKNEHARYGFTICGRGIAAEGLADWTLLTEDKTLLAQYLRLAVSEVFGVYTVEADGGRMAAPGYTRCVRVSDDALYFELLLGQADYLPASFAVQAILPPASPLAATHSLQVYRAAVELQTVGEYLVAADQPRLLHRAGEDGTVHRYLSWRENPHAAAYELSFAVCTEQGALIPGSQRLYIGQYTVANGRAEVDITPYLRRDLAVAYGEGTYQIIMLGARANNPAYRFYNTSLSLTAGNYLRLSLNGRGTETAADMAADGVALALQDMHLSAAAADMGMPEGRWTLRVTVLDAGNLDVSAAFTWAEAAPTFPLGADAALEGDPESLPLGTLLPRPGTPPGNYSVFIQLQLRDENTGRSQSVNVSGAVILAPAAD